MRLPLLYAYISKPAIEAIESFLRTLEAQGVVISHLGKTDPPRRFHGGINEAVSAIEIGPDLTDYTFFRDAKRGLDFDLQVRNDPRWNYSTVSATCLDFDSLRIVATCAVSAFDVFIGIQGTTEGGKEQKWDVIHVSERCPPELHARFVS